MENRLIYDGPNSIMSDFIKTDDILKDMCGIIESSQKRDYRRNEGLLPEKGDNRKKGNRNGSKI